MGFLFIQLTEVPMKMRVFVLLFLLCALPMSLFASGGHDGLDCVGCHGIHTAEVKKQIFAVVPNSKDINPATNSIYSGVTAICLSCHQQSEQGGQDIIPVVGHMSHPYNISDINPRVASVPASSMRDGVFECVGCHDPHPSNPNYKYLLVATGGGSDLTKFCSVCHAAKVDPTGRNKSDLFSSMDERKVQ